MSAICERTDVLVIGTGFGGAIPAYNLAAGGAKVIMLERGPELGAADFTQSLEIGGYTRIVDLIQGNGIQVVAGNCVGGSSVVYFAASLRAPSFVFERRGSAGRRLWPSGLTRSALDPWYDRVEATIPVAQQSWDDVPYAGGVWAAACANAGHTCNPVPLAVDLEHCTNCNWMLNGCRFDAKRSMLLNYLPAARAHGAQVRPLHEVQSIAKSLTPGYRYRVDYTVVDASDYRIPAGAGSIEAKVVIVAAGTMGTPVILKRSGLGLGSVPSAVGKYFSPNGDRVSMAVLDEGAVGNVLGLERAPGTAYEAFPIGKPIGSMSYDYLDPARPEFERFGLQQIYFPAITNLLPEDGTPAAPDWYGVDKKLLSQRWRSWLTLLAMTEDDNEGQWGVLPPTGNFLRVASSAVVSSLTYQPNANTRRGFAASDAALRSIIEKDGIGKHLDWVGGQPVLSAHPLASCRLGDDPATSALGPDHQLRGHAGLFVTDGSAVPTSLTVNPSLTIAALAERASPGIARFARSLGLDVAASVPPPGG
ncbi:GMC family oxidoreductase N-terminal domain-containing protein [Nocardioides marmorisolisilvae]|uniref:GMC family oxidoreductase n=1 Tax=Nocardioides marmorisolisilvae TaxID=1542737 RepID=A0A3N0DX76_9ACTN|nr:GMC family oxidoreductase [Nocardioides marmorisolisilvae]RNL80053.1 GMC family oxidoreductase [Nocardioides marmorisolisilvae]